jgi:MFS transporter, Spinster family, sphingosine-1-phosphate transporter
VSVSNPPSLGPQGAQQRRWAFAVLVALTAINFVNYLDRYVLSAVLEEVRLELDVSDGAAGLLGTMFMVVYTVAAPFSGYIGDRWRRNRMVAAAVAAWSLATVGSGLAPDYETLLVLRALVGVGEAGYATVAPAIIADLFAPSERGRKLAWFYLAIPLGSALGYLVGGWVGEHHGWRAAFFVAGGPGLLLAVVALFLPDPKRGALDDDGSGAERFDLRGGLRRVFASPAWRINTVGTTLMTFAMGGLAFWMPTFLVRSQGLGLAEANTWFGGVTVVAGLLGTLVGGHLGDRAFARSSGGYFAVSGRGLLLGAPFAFALPWLPSPGLIFGCVFFAQVLLFLNTGPLNAALVASVPPRLRATAVAVNVFFIHALGDAISPYLMGTLSEVSDLGTAIGATSLPIAMGGIVLLVGARRMRCLPDGLRTVDAVSPPDIRD